VRCCCAAEAGSGGQAHAHRGSKTAAAERRRRHARSGTAPAPMRLGGRKQPAAQRRHLGVRAEAEHEDVRGSTLGSGRGHCSCAARLCCPGRSSRREQSASAAAPPSCTPCAPGRPSTSAFSQRLNSSMSNDSAGSQVDDFAQLQAQAAAPESAEHAMPSRAALLLPPPGQSPPLHETLDIAELLAASPGASRRSTDAQAQFWRGAKWCVMLRALRLDAQLTLQPLQVARWLPRAPSARVTHPRSLRSRRLRPRRCVWLDCSVEAVPQTRAQRLLTESAALLRLVPLRFARSTRYVVLCLRSTRRAGSACRCLCWQSECAAVQRFLRQR
jgi:hypothetical protein